MPGHQVQNFELYKPIIVACSNDIDEEIKNKAKSYGFDQVQAAPLTASKFDD